MRILCLFYDMLRSDAVFNFQPKPKNLTNKLEQILESSGGTYFMNTYTHGPDTPRSMSCFYSGQIPSETGCDTRTSYPGIYLEFEKTFLSKLLKKNVSLFSNFSKAEKALGMLPIGSEEHVQDIHNLSPDDVIQNIEAEENCFVLVSNTSFHSAISKNSGSSLGWRNGVNSVCEHLNLWFNNKTQEFFDHIIIFSDHGCKLAFEDSSFSACTPERSKIFLYWFNKAAKKQPIEIDSELRGITDITKEITNIFLGSDRTDKSVLFSPSLRPYIMIEDYNEIFPLIGLRPDSWAVVFSDDVSIFDSRYLDRPKFLFGKNFTHETYTKKERLLEFKKIIMQDTKDYKEFNKAREAFKKLHKVKIETGSTFERKDITIILLKSYAKFEKICGKIFRKIF